MNAKTPFPAAIPTEPDTPFTQTIPDARIGGELDDDAAAIVAPAQPAPTPARSVEKPEAPVRHETLDGEDKPSRQLSLEVASACKALARGSVMTIFGRLGAEAGRRENMLTIDDIADLKKEFVKHADTLEASFIKTFEAFVHKRLRGHRTDARQFPFDRIMVHQFSHMFVRRTRENLNQGALSRRILPGFFLAVDKMLGEEAMDEFQDRARRIVARYEDQLDLDGNWATVYADPLTQALVLDALVAMSGYFKDFQKRVRWFQAMINGHLAPGDAVHGEGEDATAWELGDAGSLELLRALFKPLEGSMTDLRVRRVLVDRYGREAVAGAVDLVERFRAARILQPRSLSYAKRGFSRVPTS